MAFSPYQHWFYRTDPVTCLKVWFKAWVTKPIVYGAVSVACVGGAASALRIAAPPALYNRPLASEAPAPVWAQGLPVGASGYPAGAAPSSLARALPRGVPAVAPGAFAGGGYVVAGGLGAGLTGVSRSSDLVVVLPDQSPTERSGLASERPGGGPSATLPTPPLTPPPQLYIPDTPPPTSVPEPASLAVLIVGIGAALSMKRRRA